MLKDIFFENKFKIISTYLLAALEFFIFSLLPYMLGKSVDSLLQNNYHEFRIYLCLAGLAILVGITRRLIDTRIFIRIWNSKVIKTIENLINSKLESNQVLTRAQLVKSYPDFFEYAVPSIVSSTVEIIVAASMIILIAPITGIICFVFCLMALIISYFVSIKIKYTLDDLQKIREVRDKAILDKDSTLIKDKYRMICRLFIRVSSLDAVSWGCCNLLSLLAITVLINSIVSETTSTGMILSSTTYCVKLFASINLVSYFFIDWQRLKVYNGYLFEEKK